MRRVVAIVALGAAMVLSLTGCSGDDGPTDEQHGALLAAQDYVEAIADLDFEAADAMTDPRAFDNLPGPDTDVDIRTALPDALAPIEDPWVSLVGPTYDGTDGATEFLLDVSYTIGDLTGGDTIVLRLDEDGDPDEVDDWTVVEPLIARGETYADDSVPAAQVGRVTIDHYSSNHRGVVGYPAGYLLEPAAPTAGVEPLWLVLGAADAPTWEGELPMLEREGR
jgi:hypothetical protein